MIKALKKWIRSQQFNPTLPGILINPYYIARKGLWEAVSKYAEHFKSGVLVDVGCGDKPYQSLFDVRKYYGMEVPVSGHDPSAKRSDLFYDGLHFPFGDASVDFLFCSEVLEHVFEPELFILEMKRVLKDGGMILLTVPFIWEEHEVPFDSCRYTSFGIQHLLKKNQFEILSYEKTGNTVSCMTQIWASYLDQLLSGSNKYVKIFLNLIIISPVLVLGLILSKICSDHKGLYLDNIILVRKNIPALI